QLACGAFDAHRAVAEVDVDAARNGDGHFANSGHRGRPPSYQTWARTSPPTLRRRARFPLMTPCGVDMMAVPSPPKTRGMPDERAYTRRPGLLMRLRPIRIGSRPRPPGA